MPKETDPPDFEPEAVGPSTDPENPDWIEALYAEGASDLPPVKLDERIQAAARQPSRPWYRDLRRLTSLATAASLVVAAMVIYYAPTSEDPGLPATEKARIQAPAAETTGALEEAESPPVRADRASYRPVEAAPKQEDQPRIPDAGLENIASEVSAVRPAVVVPAEPDAARQSAILEPALREQRGVATPGKSAAATSPTQVGKRMGEPTGEQDADTTGEHLADETGADLTTLAARLEMQCGAMPGNPEQRTFAEDAKGWYLIVSDAAGAVYWRCLEGAWRTMDPQETLGSAQQQPDP